jgi:hypothetical protein
MTAPDVSTECWSDWCDDCRDPNCLCGCHEDEPDDRCPGCGADIDHYVGCPDDPDPGYEAEADYERGAS